MEVNAMQCNAARLERGSSKSKSRRRTMEDDNAVARHTNTGAGGGDGDGRSGNRSNKNWALSPLSGILWKGSRNVSNDVPHTCAYLTWRHLTVTVAVPTGGTHTLLRGLTGYAEPGCLTAVMGPSGSGKSTLIDALAGRLATNCVQSGTVLVNGRKCRLTYGSSAYVTQDENLLGTLTVAETIQYSANVRLPDTLSREEKAAIVEETMIEMGLQECAHRPIGNWHIRGISGGEKRRVSIAIGILMRPRLLFLDEPTTGLDSAAAFFVVETLRNLSRDGRTVIASVHQPSSEVFALFDNLYLLSEGRTVYFGEVNMAQQFFSQEGFPCPRNRNPADHFLRCINTDFDLVKESLSGASKLKEVMEEIEMRDPLIKINSAAAIEILTEAYQSSEYAMIAAARVQELSQHEGSVLESDASQASFYTQLKTLTKRSFVNMSRDIGYYWLRVIIYCLVSLCVGTIYFDVGTDYNAILARSSCGAFIAGFMTFMSIGGFPSFIEEMKIFYRERLDGHYGVGVFVIANFISAFPYLVMVATMSTAIVFPMVKIGGMGKFVFGLLLLLGTISVVESLMMVVASVVPNFLMGIMLGAGVMAVQMMTAGFFRLLPDLPKPIWRYPLSYLSYTSWALQGFYKNDFIGLEFDPLTSGVGKITGEYVIENFFKMSLARSKWWDLSIVWFNVVVYRSVFLLVIKFNERISPRIRGLYNSRRFGKYNVSRAPSFRTVRRQGTGTGSTPLI